MTPLLLFLLLMIGGPFWLLLRWNHGTRFAVTLLLACIASSAFLIYIEDRELPEPVALLMPYLDNDLTRWLYVGSAMFCFFRLASTRVRLPPPHPWSTGSFPLWQSQPIVTDVLIIAALLWQVNSGALSHNDHHIPFGVVAVAATAFLVASYIAQLHHGRLPFDAPIRQKKPSKPAPPYLTMLRRMPRDARDDLGSIFSRRHPALKQITKPPN